MGKKHFSISITVSVVFAIFVVLLSVCVGYFVFPRNPHIFAAGFQFTHHFFLLFSIVFLITAFRTKQKTYLFFALFWLLLWIMADAVTYIPANYSGQ
ncbi:MAG: hypothetical protein ACRC2T_12510 [Thermoguttaceae bacterium]